MLTGAYYYLCTWVPGAGRNYTGDVLYLRDNATTMVGITSDMLQSQIKQLHKVDTAEEEAKRKAWHAPESLSDYLGCHPKYTRFGLCRTLNLFSILAQTEHAPSGIEGETEAVKKMKFLRKFNRHVQQRKEVLKQIRTTLSTIQG